MSGEPVPTPDQLRRVRQLAATGAPVGVAIGTTIIWLAPPFEDALRASMMDALDALVFELEAADATLQ